MGRWVVGSSGQQHSEAILLSIRSRYLLPLIMLIAGCGGGHSPSGRWVVGSSGQQHSEAILLSIRSRYLLPLIMLIAGCGGGHSPSGRLFLATPNGANGPK